LTPEGRQVSAGRVGRPHGLDGSFHVRGATEELGVGTEVTVAGRRAVVERRAGTAERPIIRLSGVGDRDAAGGLNGEQLLVPAGELEEDEYLIDELVGCDVPGLGTVRRVVNAPSCDLLEVGDEAVLVPLISDAITNIDLEAKRIEVDRRFLGLESQEPA
jgi:16S rRNA processing protein RimM